MFVLLLCVLHTPGTMMTTHPVGGSFLCGMYAVPVKFGQCLFIIMMDRKPPGVYSHPPTLSKEHATDINLRAIGKENSAQHSEK